jgi:hypothetical protein
VPETKTPSFLQRLLTIREDPQVKNFARNRARDWDLAEDALNEAYCAVAGRDPAQIKDLRAYFYQVLKTKLYRLRGQLGAVLVEDFESLVDLRQYGAGCSSVPPRPFDDEIGTGLVAQLWLGRFAAQRDELRAGVAKRSKEPDRYRTLIVSIAEQVLRAAIEGDSCAADSNDALRAAYPQWFGPKAGAANNSHQRFVRARTDVRDLLKAVVNPDELLP